MIKINGVPTPKFPSSFQVTVSDLDDGAVTTRTMDGLLHRQVITSKRKLNLKFAMLTWSELSMLMQQIDYTFFEVEYPDSQEGRLLTKTFYVGDRTAPVAKYTEDGDLLWSDISFNFIER